MSDGIPRAPTAQRTRPIRFELIDLFILVTFAAVMAALYSFSWSARISFVLTLVATLGFAAAFTNKMVKSRSSTNFGYVIWLMFLGVVVTMFTSVGTFWVVLMLSIGVMFLGSIPADIEVNRRAVVVISMICVALGFGIWNFHKPFRVSQLEQAQQDFPIEDLSNRLEYEKDSSPLANVANRHTKGTSGSILAPKIEARLSDRESEEESFHHFYRRSDLQQVHDRGYSEFVRAVGFGAVRMRGISSSRLKAPELHSIGFDERQTLNSPKGSHDDWNWHLRWKEEDEPTNFEEFHQMGETDFVHPNTIGFVFGPRQAAGFLSHAIRRPIVQSNDDWFETSRWKLDRMQLISLLRFGSPRAYVLDHMPRMDEISSEDIPTRGLRQFETEALVKLESEEDLVFHESADEILMVGSLRAIHSCTECHSVDRGHLLGAFTYRFVPARSPLEDLVDQR